MDSHFFSVLLAHYLTVYVIFYVYIYIIFIYVSIYIYIDILLLIDCLYNMLFVYLELVTKIISPLDYQSISDSDSVVYSIQYLQLKYNL